ncbi:MAG: EF-hand domain-containing protein [Proteobacteria bacterium]|nr:EF-hand domain-containing protein [Pseudomonadota bacterium]MCP4915969.1 EF-hand domain-containing protein [Pseudomonadota bacterium]
MIWLLACSGTTEPVAPARPKLGDQAAQELMAVLDTDGDGRLSSKEFALRAEPGVALSDWDLDGDLSLSVEELRAGMWEHSPLIDGHAQPEKPPLR